MKQAMSVKMALIALAFCILSGSAAMAADPAVNYYYDGGQKRALLLDDTLVAAFGAAPAAVKSALPGAIAKVNGGATIYRAQTGSYKSALGVASGAAISPVFHEGGSRAGRLMALPGGVVVNFKAEWTAQQVNDWAAAKGLLIDKKLAVGQNWYVIKSGSGQASLDLANQIHQSGEVVSASPNWWKEVSTR